MKKFLAPVVLTVVLVGGLGIAAWQPWASKEREQEIEWLEGYATWSERIDLAFDAEDDAALDRCDASYADLVGEPPQRLARAGSIAQDGCRAVREALATGEHETLDAWFDVRRGVIGELTELHRRAASPTRSAELARHASPLAERTPKVYCWPTRHWDDLREDWNRVSSDELWVLGFAHPPTGTIDLAPEVCEPLHRFYRGDYAPSLSQEALDLANSLVVLAHEAEHLRSPDASEAAVECIAIQRVRDLVREAGRGAPYQELMAGLAWDVGYPDMPPEYRTETCHDGGELDVRPETDVWP